MYAPFRCTLILGTSLLFWGCAGYNPFRPGAGDIVYTTTSPLPAQAPIRSKRMYRATMRPYTVCGVTYYPRPAHVGEKFRGRASWYGGDFHGCKTSNGEYYDMYDRTAAHKTLPINTVVKVTNLRNHRTTVVRINDRGPFVNDRIIDLSYQAAQDLDMIRTGTAPVELEVLSADATANHYAHTPPIVLKKATPAPRPKPAKSTVSHTVQPAPSTASWVIQLDVFTNPAAAQTRQKELALDSPSLHPLIKTVKFHNHKLYKVIVEGFPDEAAARGYIRTHRLKGAFILRKRR